MPRTLFVARLWFEGNRFSPLPTRLAQFECREWRHGTAALDAAEGTASELAAVARLARAGIESGARAGGDIGASDWQVVVSRCASANPGGPIEPAVFDAWLGEVLADLQRQPVHAVYLSLHGAAITEHDDAPELTLLRALRARIGAQVPMAASFDLHANLNPEVATLLDFASGYRTYPHIDMDATAERVLARLCAQAEGRVGRAAGVLVHTARRLPSFNMRSADEPMRSLLAAARAAEGVPGVLDASLFGGFPYADTADTGASAMAWAESPAQAQAVARSLAAALVAQETAFAPRLLPAGEAIRQAAAAGIAPGAGIVAVTDPADNPLSGGALDTPGLFAELLRQWREPAGALRRFGPGRVAFAAFADPGAVAAARAAWQAQGPGAALTLALGGRHSPAYGAPVTVQARVRRITDGRFVNEGPMERGCAVSLGPTAVLDLEGLQVIVITEVGAANDPGFFRLHGIDLAGPLLLAVKAKNHFRAAFVPLCAAIVDADCPGPAAADLATLPFRHEPASR